MHCITAKYVPNYVEEQTPGTLRHGVASLRFEASTLLEAMQCPAVLVDDSRATLQGRVTGERGEEGGGLPLWIEEFNFRWLQTWKRRTDEPESLNNPGVSPRQRKILQMDQNFRHAASSQ